MSENDIINLAQNKQDSAMEYLLEKYKPLVRKRTNAMYLMGGETEDLIQEGMIGLYKAIRTYRPGESAFASYAQVCVNRQMYTAVQASGRKKHEPLNEYISLSEDLNLFLLDNPESRMIAQENMEKRYQLIDKQLSSMERQVLKLYLEGGSYEEIAEEMGRSEKSVDNAIQRLKKKLKKVEKSVDGARRAGNGHSIRAVRLSAGRGNARRRSRP